MKFKPSQHSLPNPGVRAGAGPATGQYYVTIAGERGMSPDGWHWGYLSGRVPELVKIKGPLVPGTRIQFKRMHGNTATQWAVLRDRKVMPQHSAGLPGATGMPGPGMVGFDAYSMHPGVRVRVPPVPVPNPRKIDLSNMQIVAPVAVAGVLGLLVVGPLVITPFVLKAFVPKWSYGRRVVAGFGISLALGAANKLIKTAREPAPTALILRENPGYGLLEIFSKPAHGAAQTTANRGVGDIDMIIIHTSEGDPTSSYGPADWFQDPRSNASAHYNVYGTGTIYQSVQDKDIAWHAGNSAVNKRSIGIEIQARAEKANWNELQLLQTARLTAGLARKYGIPIDREHIQGHVEVSGPGGHEDPGPHFPWDRFIKMVKAADNPFSQAMKTATNWLLPLSLATAGLAGLYFLEKYVEKKKVQR